MLKTIIYCTLTLWVAGSRANWFIGWRHLPKYRREGSLFRHIIMLPRVMLTFVTTPLDPTWTLDSLTCNDEVGSPLRYNICIYTQVQDKNLVMQFMELGHKYYFPIIVCEEGMLRTKAKGCQACKILETWPPRFRFIYIKVSNTLRGRGALDGHFCICNHLVWNMKHAMNLVQDDLGTSKSVLICVIIFGARSDEYLVHCQSEVNVWCSLKWLCSLPIMLAIELGMGSIF